MWVFSVFEKRKKNHFEGGMLGAEHMRGEEAIRIWAPGEDLHWFDLHDILEAAVRQ